MTAGLYAPWGVEMAYEQGRSCDQRVIVRRAVLALDTGLQSSTFTFTPSPSGQVASDPMHYNKHWTLNCSLFEYLGGGSTVTFR